MDMFQLLPVLNITTDNGEENWKYWLQKFYQYMIAIGANT